MGYQTERDGNIFVCDLKDDPRNVHTEVTVESVMTDEWLDGFLTMNGTADEQRAAAAAMLKSIHYPIAAASIVENGKMVACGLGVDRAGGMWGCTTSMWTPAAAAGVWAGTSAPPL